MKKCLLFLLLLTTSGLARTMAQAPTEEQQVDPVAKTRLEKLKITYIGQHLNLNPQESKEFWPVYFQYENELRSTRNNGSLDQLAKEEAIVNVKRRYQNQFTGLIGRNRANYVFQLEHDFNQLLFNRIRPNPHMGMRRGF